MTCLLLMVALTTHQSPLTTHEPNWPQFRGGSAAGVAPQQGLPDSWSTSKNVVWKTEVPGTGWSCPIVWGDKIFLTSTTRDGPGEAPKKGLYLGGDRFKPPADTHHWKVYCIDFNTGKILWEKQVHEGKPQGTIHIKNTYA